MKVRINRKGILFLIFAALFVAILVLGIILLVSRGSTTEVDTTTHKADSLSLIDTLPHSETDEFQDDSTAMFDTMTVANVVSNQNWLEKLIHQNRHKSLYGINASPYDVEVSEIQSGETFSRLMNGKYEVNIAIINSLIEKSKGVFDMRDLRVGNPYTAFLSQDTTAGGKLQYLVYEKSATEYIIFSAADSIYVRKEKKDVTSQESFAQGVITSSLWMSMYQNGFNTALADRLSEIFKYTVDFFAIQKGDSYRVIYEERFIDTVSIGIGQIYGAELIHNGKPYMAISFEQASKGGDIERGYWDEMGKNLRKNFLAAPLSFKARVSSKFGVRVHPISRRRRQHNGIDYAVPTGTPVLCVADGTVTAKGWDIGGGGNRLWVRHAQGLESAYLHLSRFASGIKAGSKVRQGQVIAYVGSTGASTGPHLDFRIRQKGKYIDPAKTPSTPTDPIAEKNKTAFNRMKNDVLGVMNQYSKPKKK